MLSSLIKSFDPFIPGPFKIFKNGIWDDPKVNVYINEEENFAFLYPQPIVDYYNYLSRYKILQLQNNKLFWNERRIFKINSYIERLKIKASISKRKLSLIEIGSSKGEFLISIHKFFPAIE